LPATEAGVVPRSGGQIAMSNPGISKIEFAADSPLEKAVSSEPVSERGSSAAGNYGTIPRRLWMITEAEKGHFGLEYAGIWVFALR
jgi:hypothetical protein